MNLERDLFEAILENPDDMTPRLIYADWCDDQGDPRGEFIRIQCELADYVGPLIKVRHLKRREAELWEQNRRAWNGEIHRRLAETPLRNQVDSRHGLVRKWEYHRGFVEYAIVETHIFLKYPDPLFQIGPLKRLRLLHLGFEDDFQRAVRSPFLLRLKAVELFLPDMSLDTAEYLIKMNRTENTSQVQIQPIGCLA